ncbi:phage tail family protein [Niallia taxi]|uniref:Phage tail family protein n=1 Tax=Niallia taxi TaxID=2499688 RepID=A0A437K4A4_9BACI|nr:phage tail family protein [Niallia taxi]RVT57410.1 phage tail family protein [Niallia taxi]
MNMIVTKLDGKTYDLESMGITLREFNPESPSPRHVTEEIEGIHGLIDNGTTYAERKINCSFYLKAVDVEDYYLFRDEIFALFDSSQAFYVTESRNIGKRWLVKTDGTYSIDQERVYGMFDVTFVAFQPFAESRGTTLSPFSFDSDLWQIGEGLDDGIPPQYRFNTTTFRVYNAGNVVVSPVQMPMQITYLGESSTLQIKNRTTGDAWLYSGTSEPNDVIDLNRVQAKKNSVSIFAATNRKYITLAPGWNEFILLGTRGSFEIAFNFRYYYL